MLDPAEARLWAEEIASLVAYVEARLCKSIARTVWADMGASSTDVARLAKVATVRAELERQLGRGWQRVIRRAQEVLNMARDAGQGQAVKDLAKAGYPTIFPTVQAAAVETIAADLIAHLSQIPPIALREAVDVYQRIISRPVASVTTGAETRLKATQGALNSFARHGISGFTDKAGRRWHMDTYAEMATRTGATHSLVYGWANTMTVNGEDLALVSDHAFECPMCAPWENQVISLTGQYKGRVSVQHATREDQTVTVNVKGTLEEAKQAGLYHPNCGHTMRLFLPGITRQARPQHDPARYEASQKQRALEREIRKQKRLEAVNMIGDPTPTQTIRECQKQIRELTAKYDLPRKRVREQIKKAH